MNTKALIAGIAALLAVACAKNGTSADALPEVGGIDDLNGRTVAVITGSIQDVNICDKRPDIIPLRINSIAEMFAAVENGKSEFFLADSMTVIGSHLEERGLKCMFVDVEYGGSAGVSFNKNNKILCEQFNEFFHGMEADGTWKEILNRWTADSAMDSDIPADITSKNAALLAESPKSVLRMGTFPTAPFDFVKDGQWTGLEVEMMMRFAISLDRPLEVVNMDFGGLVPAVSTGRVDMVAAFLFITPERQKQVLFSDPYLFSATGCFGRAAVGAKKEGLTFARIKESFNNNLLVENRWKLLLQGLWETLIISLFSILLGTLSGALMCGGRMSRNKVVSGTAKVFTDIIQGVPMLVFLMILFYVVFATSPITARWVAIIAFSINFGVYAGEMFRTGISSVDKGQTEAGLAMGFGKAGTFFYFVMPQAIKKVIPVFRGEAISLIKNTSIVGYIAIQDLTKMSDIIRSRTFDAFFPLIIISIVYFVLAWLLGKCLDSAAAKMK